MSRIKQFRLCLLFFLLMRRPEPVVVSQPVETVTDTARHVKAGKSIAEMPVKELRDETIMYK